MQKSVITTRGKSSSTWRNNTPPNRQKIGPTKVTIKQGTK